MNKEDNTVKYRDRNRFIAKRGEPSQQILMSDISILKGIGGFVIISFASGEQVVEYATSIDQAITTIREQLEKMI